MLSDLACSKAKPGPKPVKLSDAHGLYLLIKPSGMKSWRYNYRHQGKQKTIVLGEYPHLSLLDARIEHERLRQLVKAKIDPMEERRVAKLVPESGDTFAAVFEEWHAKMTPAWSEGHTKLIRVRFEKDLIPDLGKLRMVDITAPVLLAVLQKIEKRGKLYTVMRCRENVGTLFRYAIRTGRCSHDPSHDLRGAFIGHVEKHRPAIVDPEGVADLLRAIWNYEGSFTTRQAFRLSTLVGLRPGEISNLEWSKVDFERREIRLGEETKMKTPHIVPLSRQALEVLRETEEVSGHCRFVFPSARNPRGDRPMSNATITSALNRLGFQGKQSAHGLRGTFCSLLTESGRWSADAVERQLAHQERNKVRRAYLHAQFMPERIRMMQWWADHLDELRTGQPRRGKVLKFPG